nr:unnamed protein product [Callosobruchus analis]
MNRKIGVTRLQRFLAGGKPVWLSGVQARGCPWLSLAVHWLSMAVRGCPWLSMAVRGCPWLSMAVLGCPWLSVAVRSCPSLRFACLPR